MQIHEVKTPIGQFEAVCLEYKKFEIQESNRGFHPGDFLLLQEYDTQLQVPTGRTALCKVKYITHGPAAGVQPGFCVMSIKLLQ